MKDAAFYEHLLGLKTPRPVKKVAVAMSRALSSYFTAVIAASKQRLRQAISTLGHLGALITQSFANERQHAVGYAWFSDHEAAGYHRAFDARDPAGVDNATWRDLDVATYLQLIGAQCSIFGRQMLYRWLRVGNPGCDSSAAPLKAATEAQMQALLAATRDIRHTLRSVDLDITSFLFHEQLTTVPRWAFRLKVIPYVGLATLVCWKLLPGVATVYIVFVYLAFNAWVQIKLHRTLVQWQRQRDAVLAVLGAALAFGRVGQNTPHPILNELTNQLKEVQRLRSVVSPSWAEGTPWVAEYVNLIMFYQYARLGPNVQGFKAQLPALRTVYEQLARCEAYLCLSEHLRAHPVWCWAHTTQARKIRLQGSVNPLLLSPDALSIDLRDKGAFITGQNGVGKSTFLRGLGLNLLAGRAFGFCYAKQAQVPMLPVWSSIQNEDSLETADSLYMAEMSRAETLLRVAEQPGGAVFIIDEIFRGTNNLESVSTAAAVLHQLSTRALVVVSSHNLVLAPLLRSTLDALRIVRCPANAGALQMEPGVLVETNGIQMMEQYAMPEQVHANAKRVHDWFAGYVTQPEGFPTLL